jgi:hypothetical protein
MLSDATLPTSYHSLKELLDAHQRHTASREEMRLFVQREGITASLFTDINYRLGACDILNETQLQTLLTIVLEIFEQSQLQADISHDVRAQLDSLFYNIDSSVVPYIQKRKRDNHHAYDVDIIGYWCQWPTELSHFWPLILSHFSREKSLVQF